MRNQFIAALLLASVICSPAASASSIKSVIDVPWQTLLGKLASNPARFAVPVQLTGDPSTMGSWTDNGDVATWTYTVTAVGATSVGLHAKAFRLPPGGTFTIRGGGASHDVSNLDATLRGLWIVPVPGDTATLTVNVPSRLRKDFILDIVEVQAGYKRTSNSSQDSKAYTEFAAAAASAGSACAVNYQCQSFPAGDKNSKATVVIVIENVGQCTGTLLNSILLSLEEFLVFPI